MSNAPTLFTFFSGAGFLDLGFSDSGYKIVFVNEYHKPFLDTYIYSRQVLQHPEPEFGYHLKDISNFTKDPEKCELHEMIQICRSRNELIGFIGGPPCPDFSVGGKNRGSEGENGKLTATYVNLICQQQPDFFVFENVKGLWRTKKHREFFESMKATLHEHGYSTTERLIDAIEYGVPQQRERIILIGFKTEILKNRGFEIEKGVMLDDIFPWMNRIKFSKERLQKIPFPTQDPFQEDGQLAKPAGVPEELTVEYWFNKNDVYYHPNALDFFQPRAGLAKFLVIPEGDDSKKSYKRLHRWRYSPTAAYGNNEVHLHPYKARRLSVSEALAIQSLPKSFALPPDITLSNAFKTIGNGVPYLAAKGIADTILDFLQQTEKR
ncbi:DNA cytosine methyltransferase [Brevibacillus agri]|uniref:DNA cytosine methyltransferase n=1 Tax=Brevibacillus agri TaxID=51101 RepID=UPI0004712808|nr:DNA cytosine methyltransferase [Brevibacillus agri]